MDTNQRRCGRSPCSTTIPTKIHQHGTETRDGNGFAMLRNRSDDRVLTSLEDLEMSAKAGGAIFAIV
jgi:hypothetical protein